MTEGLRRIGWALISIASIAVGSMLVATPVTMGTESVSGTVFVVGIGAMIVGFGLVFFADEVLVDEESAGSPDEIEEVSVS